VSSIDATRGRRQLSAISAPRIPSLVKVHDEVHRRSEAIVAWRVPISRISRAVGELKNVGAVADGDIAELSHDVAAQWSGNVDHIVIVAQLASSVEQLSHQMTRPVTHISRDRGGDQLSEASPTLRVLRGVHMQDPLAESLRNVVRMIAHARESD
jgi:hypothetical protein